MGGTGKLVILPVDQGFEHGPIQSFEKNPSGYDPLYHVDLAVEAGCSAFAAPLGFIEMASSERAEKIPLILKLNHSDSLYKDSKGPISSAASDIESAVRLKCLAVGFTIYPGSSNRKAQYEELALVSRLARKAGLLLVVWSYPRGEGLSKKGETALDVVSYAAHIACQMGAHIVKVKPPSEWIEQDSAKKLLPDQPIKNLSERVPYVMKSAFNSRRLVIFSGGASKDKSAFLDEVKELHAGGASGSIIGRNAFQRPRAEALKLLSEVMEIYKS